ncbi:MULTISPECIES: class I SAM-dependent methyltransferase [Kitasatospora]|uniref:Putative methyltransferase n=1 Tax=Kitasatospora setae (strain ATCC 33774 / DSM 43861 / JCM 3304 / KCC A-0304 / NBRC 14216 / KM-6054) TaxID=452652 RepID=E4NJB8_KITSK|nr:MULTISPECIES: class I SAM-dependent methyltransferase [Kitasatospora]BAJ33066.1 putative methyltransferase [Kitasatospora setae KM-6054]
MAAQEREPAQYDVIGERYSDFKRHHGLSPEEPTVRALLGDLTGARVLDLACGFGQYTRLARRLGAARAEGVDISAEMVAQARQQEERDPAGAVYHQYDAAALPVLGSFDAVVAIWLFNYAEDPGRMADMFRGVRANLAAGGRLVAVTVHPGYDPDDPDRQPLRARITAARPVPRGTALVLEFPVEPPVELSFTRWDADVYEQSARAAGFTDLTWHPVTHPEAGTPDGGDPFIVALTCE